MYVYAYVLSAQKLYAHALQFSVYILNLQIQSQICRNSSLIQSMSINSKNSFSEGDSSNSTTNTRCSQLAVISSYTKYLGLQ